MLYHFHNLLPLSRSNFFFSLQHHHPMWKKSISSFIAIPRLFSVLISSFVQCLQFLNFFLYISYISIHLHWKAFGLCFICHRHIKILLLVSFILSLYFLTVVYYVDQLFFLQALFSLWVEHLLATNLYQAGKKLLWDIIMFCKIHDKVLLNSMKK